MTKQGKNYTQRKLNTHKLSNQNAEKILINRNEYSYILSFYTNYAKTTLDSAKHEQQLNTEHRKRKLKQRHIIYELEIINDKYRKIPHNTAYTNLKHNITTGYASKYAAYIPR